ncbi:PREDICTED: defensin-like protein 32 [Camelina sativa]|uniref:Defensin-like protein 32 n=1 Tax=Camelina sativa TaxID=90675 RepID=A0ABM1R689_CAMSA|nr:PREDICTED: defensin-like protein 32 [Camelina sativa]
MSSSGKFVFLVFLCLVVLSIPRSTKTKHIDGRKPLLIGSCIEFPTAKCNKTCIESHFSGGTCVHVGQSLDFVCVCFS